MTDFSRPLKAALILAAPLKPEMDAPVSARTAAAAFDLSRNATNKRHDAIHAAFNRHSCSLSTLLPRNPFLIICVIPLCKSLYSRPSTLDWFPNSRRTSQQTDLDSRFISQSIDAKTLVYKRTLHATSTIDLPLSRANVTVFQYFSFRHEKLAAKTDM